MYSDISSEATFVFFIVAFISLVVYLWICGRIVDVAEEKGHPSDGLFAVCVLLGIAGMIYTASLPDLKARQGCDEISQYSTESDE